MGEAVAAAAAGPEAVTALVTTGVQLLMLVITCRLCHLEGQICKCHSGAAFAAHPTCMPWASRAAPLGTMPSLTVWKSSSCNWLMLTHMPVDGSKALLTR